MRRFIHIVLTLLALVSTFSPPSRGESTDARGLLVYKLTPQDSTERALVAEYTEIKIFPNVVNGKRVDGSDFRIISGAFLDFIEYPDLTRGVFRTPEQIETLKIAGRKMVATAEKYPVSQNVLAPRIEQLKLAANKLNSGMILVNGKYLNPREDVISGPASSSIASITTVTGKEIEVTKFLSANQTTIGIMHSGGVQNLLWVQITEESRKALESNPAFLAVRKTESIPRSENPEPISESGSMSPDITEDQARAIDTLASVFFRDYKGRRVDEIPLQHQGTWIVTSHLDVITLSDLTTATDRGAVTSVAENNGAIFRLEAKSFYIGQVRAQIRYVATDLAGDRICVVAGDVFFLKLDNVFIFLDLEALARAISNVLTKEVSNEFLLQQPIIQSVFAGRKQ